MRVHPSTLEAAVPNFRRRVADLLELGKLRLVSMVLITASVGFHLGCHEWSEYLALLPTLVGTGLAAAGALALNQYLERDVDSLMQRTRGRPLPDGRLQPGEALLFGTVVTALGLLCLAIAVNRLSAAVTAVTVFSYLFLYTPLKRRTPVATVIGAIPGALPPVTGWVAARNEIGVEAAVLFAILFLWQLPHSLAIARLYREDYATAGIRLLPVVDPDIRSTGHQVVANCLALVMVGLMPTLIGMTGPVYFLVALVLGMTFLGYGIAFAISRGRPAARKLLFASLLYLPLLLISMALDKTGF